MMSRTQLEQVKPGLLLGRFRSKEDLFKYLTEQGKSRSSFLLFVVGLFLPSMSGTTLNFIRSILKDEKKVLYQKDVKTMLVP